MRYDQTVPLARVIAQYQNEIPLPFKRYQIQNVWRAENTQKGRYREFLQVDADIVGTYSPLADAEIIAVSAKCLEKLGFKEFKILINDRANFRELSPKAVAIIDKLKKIGPSAVSEELRKNNFDENLLMKIKNKKVSKKIEEIANAVYKIDRSLKEQIIYESTLARGLDYYTELIFEVEVQDYGGGVVAGGGRYDNLIGMFSKRDIPAVGFSFGFDRLIEAMKQLNLFPNNLNGNEVLIAFADSELQKKAMEISAKLRNKGLNTEFYLEDVPLEKQLKYADKKNIAYVLIVNSNNLILKNMASGEQKKVILENLPDELR